MAPIGDAFERSLQSTLAPHAAQAVTKAAADQAAAAVALSLARDAAKFPQREQVAKLAGEALEVLSGERSVFQASVTANRGFFSKLTAYAKGDRQSVLSEYLGSLKSTSQQGQGGLGDLFGKLVDVATEANRATGEAGTTREALHAALSGIKGLATAEPEAALKSTVMQVLDRAAVEGAPDLARRQANLAVVQHMARADAAPSSALMARLAGDGLSNGGATRMNFSEQAIRALAEGKNPTAAVLEQGAKWADQQGQTAWLESALSTLKVLGSEREADTVTTRLIDQALEHQRLHPGTHLSTQRMATAIDTLRTWTATAPSEAPRTTIQHLLDQGFAASENKNLSYDLQYAWMEANREALVTVSSGAREANLQLAGTLAGLAAPNREESYATLTAIKGALAATSADPRRETAKHLTGVLVPYFGKGSWDTRLGYTRSYLKLVDRLATDHPELVELKQVTGKALEAGKGKALGDYERLESAARAADVLLGTENHTVTAAFGKLSDVADKYANANKTQIDTYNTQLRAWLDTLQDLKAGHPQLEVVDELLAFGTSTHQAQPTGLNTFESLRASISGLNQLSSGVTPDATRAKLASTVIEWVNDPKNSKATLDSKSIWMNARVGALQAMAPAEQQALLGQARTTFARTPAGLETYEVLMGSLVAARELANGATPEQTVATLARKIMGSAEKGDTEWKYKAEWLRGYMRAAREVAPLATDPGVRALKGVLDGPLASTGAPSRKTYMDLYAATLGVRDFPAGMGDEAGLSAAEKLIDSAREFARTNTSSLDNKAGWLASYLATAGQLARTSTQPRGALLGELADTRLKAIAPQPATQESYDALASALDFGKDLLSRTRRLEAGATIPSLAELQTEHLQRKLLGTQAAAVMPADVDGLMAAFRAGAFEPGGKTVLNFGNVSQTTQTKLGFAVGVLSSDGKQALATAPEALKLDRALVRGREGQLWTGKDDLSALHKGLRFGAEAPLVTPLEPQKHFQRVLLHPDDYKVFMAKYEAAIADGSVPATLNGKPYKQYFQSSDDFYNELQTDHLRDLLPGFTERSLDEQAAVAALASKVATTFPASVPQETRLKVAAAMVQFKPVPGSTQGLPGPVDELRHFYHGTRSAKAIVQGGGFKVGPRAVYGSGIYHGGATITAGYAMGDDFSKAADLVSGTMAPGKISRKDFSGDTRLVLRNYQSYPEAGDYLVTKDPKRFSIQSVTTYDPAVVKPEAVPELLKVRDAATDWVDQTLAKVPGAEADRAVLHAFTYGDAEIQAAARKFMVGRQAELTLPAALEGKTLFKALNQGGIEGGHLPKQVLLDESGQRWLLKTVPEKEGYRALGDTTGSEVLAAIGLATPPVHAVTGTVAGKTLPGTLQPMLTHSGKILPDKASELTSEQVDDLVQGQVGRWLISDHDGKVANFLLMPDGRLNSIDLGQMFRFFPQDQLSRSYKPNSEAPIFNELWRGYVKGEVKVDFSKGLEAIARVEALPDDRFTAMLRPYVEARYAQAGAVAGLASVDDFLRAAIERKHHIRQDFTAFYDSLAKERGLAGLTEALASKTN